MDDRKILKINNKDNNFYMYMGKFFGSRVVQNKINDRIYDDANKEWYVLLEENNCVAFASLIKNTIKNIYAVKDEQLEYLLSDLNDQIKFAKSVVPAIYKDVYIKVGLNVQDNCKFKNFVVISSKEGE